MQVTLKSHPYLFEAFLTIDHDSGRSIGRGDAPIVYNVPERCEELVRPAERALAGLTASERETVAIGEETEATAIVGLLGDDGVKLEELLAEHFCDYCAGSNPEGP